MQHAHGTCVILGDRGVLICGDSGSGKSALARRLVLNAQLHGHFGCLVCDDAVRLAVVEGRLVATCVDAIAGLIEVRGCGLIQTPHRRGAVVDLMVRLVAAEDSPRMPDVLTDSIDGLAIRSLRLPRGNAEGAAAAITAALLNLS